MALVTIPSILRFLSKNQKLFIIDDGSLTEKEVSTLKHIDPNLQVITRLEREERVLSELKNYPQCQKYRRKIPLAFKLLDIPLLVRDSGISRYTFTDSDIIYLKNCFDYFNRNSNTYLNASVSAYSVRLSKVFFKYKWKIPLKFNSGYFSFDVKDYDLDFIEHYLSLPDVYNFPWLTEQTCWALIFSRSGKSFCTSENQFVCRDFVENFESQMLAIHLISELKSKYYEWSKNSDENNYFPIDPLFKLSKNISLFDWVNKSVSRYI